MTFSWLTIAIALVLAFVAFKLLMGVIRVVAVVGVLGLGFYLYSSGALA